MPDGHLVACFVVGEIFTLRSDTVTWALFADGLPIGLGFAALNISQVWVDQAPLPTHIRDLDDVDTVYQ